MHLFFNNGSDKGKGEDVGFNVQRMLKVNSSV